MRRPAIELLTCPVARKRRWYFAAVIAVVALGLTSRRTSWLFPHVLGKYPGDALWAVVVFLGWGFVFSSNSTLRIGVYAMASAVCVECLKLCEFRALEVIRNTVVGRLVFGYVFSWENLAAYAAGIAVAMMIECRMHMSGCGHPLSMRPDEEHP